jgi:pimeloyl-ACP methyl ester carboxylesterase
MPAFGAQVVALLDHLDEPEAVVMGTSLGANAVLEAVAQAPERFRGMIVEMPVLDHALIGCALAFTPLMVALTAGEPAMRLLARAARLVPRRTLPWQADILLDWIRQDPEPSAAVLQGLFFGRTAPPRDERREMQTPALVIGHQYDLIHPFSDAGMLVSELPNGRLLEASSLIELRVAPRRLTGEIAGFADECWRPRAARSRARAS